MAYIRQRVTRRTFTDAHTGSDVEIVEEINGGLARWCVDVTEE